MAQDGQVVLCGTVVRVLGSCSWYKEIGLLHIVHRLGVCWERRGRLQVGQYVGRVGMGMSWSQTHVSVWMKLWSVVMSVWLGGLS